MELSNQDNYFSPEIMSIFSEINQSRSAYQLEKFVLGQHDTPEMRYYQCILELQTLYSNLKIANLEAKKKKIEITRLLSTGDAIDAIDAEIKEFSLMETEAVAAGAIRELEALLTFLGTFPKYTRQQIDEAQPEYWTRRLTRQYELAGATNTANQAAHLDSLIQIGQVSFNAQEEIETTDRKELSNDTD